MEKKSANGPIYVWYGVPDGHWIVATGVNLTNGNVYSNNPWGVSGAQTYNQFLNGFLNMEPDMPMSGIGIWRP